MLSSEANDIMEKESKKTMGVEHIAEALRGLGFPEYVKEIVAAVEEHKEQLRVSSVCCPGDKCLLTCVPRQGRRGQPNWTRVV